MQTIPWTVALPATALLLGFFFWGALTLLHSFNNLNTDP
jgi:hypothetical protein